MSGRSDLRPHHNPSRLTSASRISNALVGGMLRLGIASDARGSAWSYRGRGKD
jgi:hypothetical protein